MLSKVVYWVFIFFSVPCFPIFRIDRTLVTYHVFIWQVFLQACCGDNCEVWKWFKAPNKQFYKLEISIMRKLCTVTWLIIHVHKFKGKKHHWGLPLNHTKLRDQHFYKTINLNQGLHTVGKWFTHGNKRTLSPIILNQHWGRDKHFANDIFNGVFLNENVWITIRIFWNMYPRVLLTTSQHWFR